MQKTLERYLFGLHAERSKTEGSNNVEKAKNAEDRGRQPL